MNDRVLQSWILIPLNMEVQFAVELIIYHKIHKGDKVNLKYHLICTVSITHFLNISLVSKDLTIALIANAVGLGNKEFFGCPKIVP